MAQTVMLMLLVLPLRAVSPQRVIGIRRNETCECGVDVSAWDFHVQRFEEATELLQSCETSLGALQAQVNFTEAKVPEISATLENITEELKEFEYLNKKSLYNRLNLRQLNNELNMLEIQIQEEQQNMAMDQSKAQELTDELSDIRQRVQGLQRLDKFNLLALRDNLRTLKKNSFESCRSFGKGRPNQCFNGMLSNISSPVITQLSPHGKSYPYGSWGRETKNESMEVYWVQPLTGSDKYGHILYIYLSYADFIMSKNHKEITVRPSYSYTNAIQGPGTILYDGALYYNCYRSPNLCKYDLNTETIIEAPLPEAGYNDKFPYCYYKCCDYTDIDFSVDESGLWVIYATEENYGNVVLSKLNSTLGVIQTFRTRLFKKSVTNTFMAYGVLYATRYISTYREEVFYAFDTVTGREANALRLPFEKVSDRIQNLHYNPTDQRLYLYNDAYMMAYNLYF